MIWRGLLFLLIVSFETALLATKRMCFVSYAIFIWTYERELFRTAFCEYIVYIIMQNTLIRTISLSCLPYFSYWTNNFAVLVRIYGLFGTFVLEYLQSIWKVTCEVRCKWNQCVILYSRDFIKRGLVLDESENNLMTSYGDIAHQKVIKNSWPFHIRRLVSPTRFSVPRDFDS